MEELDFIIEASIEQMDNSIKFLEKELLNIRAGKANPNMLSRDRKSTRLNSSHSQQSRMPSSA